MSNDKRDKMIPEGLNQADWLYEDRSDDNDRHMPSRDRRRSHERKQYNYQRYNMGNRDMSRDQEYMRGYQRDTGYNRNSRHYSPGDGRMRENLEKPKERRRESYPSPERIQKYEPIDNFRAQQVETRRDRDDRGGYYQEKPPIERMSRGRAQRDYEAAYNREPYNAYPPQDRGYREERQIYRAESPNRGQRYESTRNVLPSQREQYSKFTGIPEEFIKSDAARKPGVGFQAKPSEIKYHFYIICMDCKFMPVTKVKDIILKEIEGLGCKINKESLYVDDKDLENEYKALVGFKFDHIALKIYDNLEKMKLPFPFKKELSRTFKAYYEKYEEYIKKLAYPTDPQMCPNMRIRRESESGHHRYSPISEEIRVSHSPKRDRDEGIAEYKDYGDRRSPRGYDRRRDHRTPSRSNSHDRKSYDRKRSPRRDEQDYRSNERADSPRRGGSHSSDDMVDASIDSVCYLFGLPLDITGDDINNEFAQRSIHKPVKVERVKKTDDFGNDCMYFCMTFEVAVSVDRLLEQEFSIFNRNILVIPKIENNPVKRLVPYHQVLITFSYNTPGNAKQEVDCLTKFLSKYGNIVDLNLEYMPTCIIATFTRHESVLSLLSEKTLTYISSIQNRYLLNLHKMNFVLPVRAARSYLPEFLKKSSNDGKNKEDDNLVDMNKDIKRESSPNSHQNAQGSGE